MSTKKNALCLVLVLVLALPGMVWAADLDLEDINFPFDSRIVVDDLKQIPRLAEMLNSNPDLLLEINGYADSTGPPKYNVGLSFDRADAVMKILIDHGIAARRISIKGYGENKPKMNNETREGRFVNRHTAFSIYKITDGKKEYFYRDNLLVKPFEVVSPIVEKAPPPAVLVVAQPEVTEAIEIFDCKRASLSVGIGADDGDFTGTLDGKLFFPFYDIFAFQGGLRANMNETLKEYQFDAGMVGKYKRIQLGAFGSLKYADIDHYNDTGNLSQFSLVASFLFEKGSVGAFMTEPINSEDQIGSEQHYVRSDLVTTESYIKLRNKYGLCFDYTFENDLFLNGDIGIVRADDHKATAGLKLGYPIVAGVNVFVQGRYNDAYLEDSDNYLAVVGIELGNWNRKKSAVEDIRPMHIPEVAYELETRTTTLKDKHDPNKPPEVSMFYSRVEDQAFALSFTGNAIDPDGQIVSYEWNFGDGNTGSGKTIDHTFPNKVGVYSVKLTVTDNGGATATTTKSIKVPYI